MFYYKGKKKKETLNKFKQKSKLAFQKDQSRDGVDRLTWKRSQLEDDVGDLGEKC